MSDASDNYQQVAQSDMAAQLAAAQQAKANEAKTNGNPGMNVKYSVSPNAILPGRSTPAIKKGK